MSACVRCGTKIGFLGGFITSKGRVCEKCRDIENLEGKLDPVFKARTIPAMADLLAADKPMMETARKLIALDPKRPDLRSAICCVELRGGFARSESDPVIMESALAALFDVEASPVYVERILGVESGALAARFLTARGVDATEPWLALLRKLSAAGQTGAAVAVAMKARGIRSPSLCGFIAESFAPSSLLGVARWLEQSTFASVETVEEFLGIVRKRDQQLYTELLAAAERKYSGADRLDLLSELGEDVRLRKEIEGLRELTPELVAALERLSRAGKAQSVQSCLLHLATPGPFADQICNLAASLDSSDDLRNARAVMMKTEKWASARDILKERGLLTVEREQVIRASCRDAMARNDDEGLDRVAKSVAAFLDDDPKQARIILASVLDSSRNRAPMAYLSACALDALMCSAELDAATRLIQPLEIVATRRKVRKPLKDEGMVSRSLGTFRQIFVERIRRFVDADTEPAFVLLLPPSLDAKRVKAAQEADSKREALIEEAGKIADAGAITERLLLHTLRSRIFCDLVVASAEGKESPRGFRALERSMVYGQLVSRLVAPIDKEAEKPDRTGPRELSVECAARAIGFKPDVPVTSSNKWGEIMFQLSGTLRQLGYESTGVPRMDEFWPSWRNIADKPEPPDKVLAVKDHFPPLDGARGIKFEEYYRSPDKDMYPEEEKKTW